jgi:hypothetical protein
VCTSLYNEAIAICRDPSFMSLSCRGDDFGGVLQPLFSAVSESMAALVA